MGRFCLNKEYSDLVEKLKGCNIQIVDACDLGYLWQMILTLNKEKDVFGSEHTDNAKLAQLYIVEYFMFSMSIGGIEKNTEMRMIARSLLLCITNTAMSIYKLSFDGFDFQAKVLLRSLYETCMMLLNVEIDAEKRKVLFEAAKNEKEYDAWRKYFKPSKLKETLQSFEESLGKAVSGEWHKQVYKDLSAYAHNEFWGFFPYSCAMPRGEDEIISINPVGSYATRSESLLSEMNSILFYTGAIFQKGLRSDGFNKESLCEDEGGPSDKIDAWDIACFLDMLNQRCFIKLVDDEANDM